MNFYKFHGRLCVQNNIKHEQLVYTAAFNASGWIFAKKI
jgi:hypothetical protein